MNNINSDDAVLAIIIATATAQPDLGESRYKYKIIFYYLFLLSMFEYVCSRRFCSKLELLL